MTMLEALDFLSLFTEYLENSVAAHDVRFSNLKKMPKWTKPTRAQVTEMLRANKAAFPRDKDVTNSFTRNVDIARKKHWMLQGPCQPHCHAAHLWLTELGSEALQMMREQGCETGEHIYLVGKVYRFERKARVA